MKAIALAVLFGLLSSALGVLLAQEKARTRQLTARLAEIEVHVQQQRVEIESQVQAVTALEQEKTRLAAKVESTKQKLIAAREAGSTATGRLASPAMGASQEEAEAAARAEAKAKTAGGSAGMKGYLNSMMKDPAMKKMMRSAQAMGMKQMYGDLVKQWGLSPEESNSFYDLLLDRQMGIMDKNLNAINNVTSGDAKTAASAPAEDPDAALKSSLGDKLYQQYKDYEKTIGDRAILGQIQQHLAGDSATVLSADQSRFLLSAMAEERQLQTAANPSGQIDPNSFMKNGAFSMDQSAIDTYMKTQADLNARVSQRVAGVLTAQQLDSLKQYQTQILDIQKMGMEMARKMNADTPPAATDGAQLAPVSTVEVVNP